MHRMSSLERALVLVSFIVGLLYVLSIPDLRQYGTGLLFLSLGMLVVYLMMRRFDCLAQTVEELQRQVEAAQSPSPTEDE